MAKRKGIKVMATIKSFTSLEQSKKLAKILPLESADMYYMETSRNNYTIGVLQRMERDMLLKQAEYYKMSPCWSLAALLSVLPNNENISTSLSRGGYRILTLEYEYTNSWFVDYEDETNGLNNCVTSADNPVDACCKMILRLHELNLL